MTSLHAIDQTANRQNLRVLINLRGMAFCAQMIAIFVTYYGLSIVLPVTYMVLTASVLAVLNLYSLHRLHVLKPVSNLDLFLGLVVDVLVLALQLHFSGGTSNPFVSFFMLPVIIGAVMLSAVYAWSIYGITLLAYLALAVAGMGHPMPQMMDMPGMEGTGHAASSLIDHSSLHMNGMMLGYGICAGALVYMITRIRNNLRTRDTELEAMKAQALEESHIIRMGLLSAGAAHELGTPLTTLSVILQDWHDLPLPRKKSDLKADIQTMQMQVSRCKAIVSDILTSSGDARGEGAGVQTLEAFLRETADTWRLSHPEASLTTEITVPAVDVVADRVIQQALTNLLDNAQEAVTSAGAAGIRFTARLEDEHVIIAVRDHGPGFTQDILDRLGQPYVTTKGATGKGHGRGLGLFLVTNTVRKLGGTFQAGNDISKDGSLLGGVVTLTLPLDAIRMTPHAN
ncbi:Sensor histidine kinase RegB (plasmid) [Asticcacaulis sp. MM231]|uniref:sensor histidine kinase n=1 Tax=Asticcacaulis sp. MM231 TaxID=3157666 RepID=UPI0032D5A1B2